MVSDPQPPKRIRKAIPDPVWCDHCNCLLKPSAVQSCLRLRCKTKALVG